MACGSLLSEEDLCRFRTKKCRRLVSGACEFGITRCQYSHNQYWSRRCPIYLSDRSFIRYVHVLCPYVVTKQVQLGDASLGNGCGRPRCMQRSGTKATGPHQNQLARGGAGKRRGKASENCCCCDDQKEEIIINNCPRGGECPFAHSTEEILYHPLFYKMVICEKYRDGVCDTYYCPYIHGLAEARQPKQYKLPFTTGIDIPPLPCVTIVAKIEKKKGSSSIPAVKDCLSSETSSGSRSQSPRPNSVNQRAMVSTQAGRPQVQTSQAVEEYGSFKDDSSAVGRQAPDDEREGSNSLLPEAVRSQRELRANGLFEDQQRWGDSSEACQILLEALQALKIESSAFCTNMAADHMPACCAELTSPPHHRGSQVEPVPVTAVAVQEQPYSEDTKPIKDLTARILGSLLIQSDRAVEAPETACSRLLPVKLLAAALELCGQADGRRAGHNSFSSQVCSQGANIRSVAADQAEQESMSDCVSSLDEAHQLRNQSESRSYIICYQGNHADDARGRVSRPTPPSESAKPAAGCVSVEASTRSSPSSSPSSILQGRRADPLTTILDNEGAAVPPCCMSTTTRSPSESGCEGELPSRSHPGSSPCSPALERSRKRIETERQRAALSTAPDTASAYATDNSDAGEEIQERDGRSSVVSETDLSTKDVKEDRPRPGEAARPWSEDKTEDSGRRFECRRQEDLVISHLSMMRAEPPEVPDNTGGAEKKGNVTAGTTLAEGDSSRSVAVAEQLKAEGGPENNSKELADIISRLEDAVKAFSEEAWMCNAEEWDRVRKATQKLCSLADLHGTGALATRTSQLSEFVDLMCALEGVSGLLAPASVSPVSKDSSPTSCSSDDSGFWSLAKYR